MNKGILLTFNTVFFTVLFQFIFIRYASYEIDKEIYGNFVLLQTLIAGLSTVLLQIPGQAFDRFYNESDNKTNFINQFRTYLIFINLLSLLIIYIYGLFINKFSSEILFLIFILFFLLNTYGLNQKIYLLNLERKRYMYLKILEASSKFLTPIVFYFYFNSLESLILGMVLGYLFSSFILYIFMKDLPFKIYFNLDNFRKYFLYAYPFLFMSIFTWGISYTDRYFIDYFLETKDIAIYAILAMVAGIGQIIGQIYFMYAEPKLLKIHNENSKLAYNTIKKYLRFLTIIFILIFLITLLLPKFLFTILLEKEIIYNEYYFNTFLILLVSIFLNILHIAHHLYIKLFKKVYILSYIYLIAFIVNIIGNLFIKDYGIIAAGISTLVAYIVILLLQIIYVSKYMKMEINNV